MASNAELLYGLTDSEYADATGGGTSGSTSSNASNWFNGLAGLVGTAATTYNAARRPATATPKTNYLPFLLLGGVGLIVVLVLALRR